MDGVEQRALGHGPADRELQLPAAVVDVPEGQQDRADPVGGLCLMEEDYLALTQLVVQAAQAQAHGRIVSLLEGGYHLDHMPTSVAAHLDGLAPA